MFDHLSVRDDGQYDADGMAEPVGVVGFEGQLVAADEPSAIGSASDATGLVIAFRNHAAPTAEQRAAMTARALAGDTLTVAMLDQLGARDALTAWAAAGFPGL